MSEQPHNRLRRLSAHIETGGAEALPGLQHEHVGAFFVHISQSQVVGTGLQDVGQGGGEVQSRSQDGAVAGEALGIGAHGFIGASDLINRCLDSAGSRP